MVEIFHKLKKKKKNFSWLSIGTTASSTSPAKTIPHAIGW